MKINPLWTAYNNIHNEGGEGFNPHNKFIGGSDGEPLWSKLDEKVRRLRNRLLGTSFDDPDYTRLEAELTELKAALAIAKREDI